MFFPVNRSLVLGGGETKGLVFPYILRETCNRPLLFYVGVHKTRVLLVVKKNVNGNMYEWIKNESHELIHITPKMKAFYVEGRLKKMKNVDGGSIFVEKGRKKQCYQGKRVEIQSKHEDKKTT